MGYEDSMNMYQAFNQNPVNFVDPYGKQAIHPHDRDMKWMSDYKPFTLKDVDTALTEISNATRYMVEGTINWALGIIQGGGHLIHATVNPYYLNRDLGYTQVDFEDPSFVVQHVDTRSADDKAIGMAGLDLIKFGVEWGKSGIKMFDPTISSEERRMHKKRFFSGVPVVAALGYGGYKLVKGKVISSVKNSIGERISVTSDDAFVHITTDKGAEAILKGGLNPEISGYVTKWKYVKDVTDPKVFNTKIYSQSISKTTASKFNKGAYILKINPKTNPKYFSPFTNRINGVPQWLFQGKTIDPSRIELIKIITGGN